MIEPKFERVDSIFERIVNSQSSIFKGKMDRILTK